MSDDDDVAPVRLGERQIAVAREGDSPPVRGPREAPRVGYEDSVIRAVWVDDADVARTRVADETPVWTPPRTGELGVGIARGSRHGLPVRAVGPDRDELLDIRVGRDEDDPGSVGGPVRSPAVLGTGAGQVPEMGAVRVGDEDVRCQ
jgi:hypothetical protein